MGIDYKDICDNVVSIARSVGHYIATERRGFSADKIEYKGEQNLVSYVDKTAERLIVERLRPLVDSAKFIAEESLSNVQAPSPNDFTWVIDPLDGTTNFIHDMPPYCVSIALMEGLDVVVGVVFEITRGECFYAWRGSECYLNGEVVRVSEVESIDKSLVITGLAYQTEDIIDNFSRAFDYFNIHSNGTRRLGSAATDLAYVAAGRGECFFQQNLSAWDVAAGAFLVERAGGTVVDYQGGDNYVFGRSIIATNRATHKLFFDKLCELS